MVFKAIGMIKNSEWIRNNEPKFFSDNWNLIPVYKIFFSYYCCEGFARYHGGNSKCKPPPHKCICKCNKNANNNKITILKISHSRYRYKSQAIHFCIFPIMNENFELPKFTHVPIKHIIIKNIRNMTDNSCKENEIFKFMRMCYDNYTWDICAVKELNWKEQKDISLEAIVSRQLIEMNLPSDELFSSQRFVFEKEYEKMVVAKHSFSIDATQYTGKFEKDDSLDLEQYYLTRQIVRYYRGIECRELEIKNINALKYDFEIIGLNIFDQQVYMKRCGREYIMHRMYEPYEGDAINVEEKTVNHEFFTVIPFTHVPTNPKKKESLERIYRSMIALWDKPFDLMKMDMLLEVLSAKKYEQKFPLWKELPNIPTAKRIFVIDDDSYNKYVILFTNVFLKKSKIEYYRAKNLNFFYKYEVVNIEIISNDGDYDDEKNYYHILINGNEGVGKSYLAAYSRLCVYHSDRNLNNIRKINERVVVCGGSKGIPVQSIVKQLKNPDSYIVLTLNLITIEDMIKSIQEIY